MAQYDQICPGFAERILAMAERQATHRHQLEATALRGNVANQRLGSVLGFVVAITAVSGGIWLLGRGVNIGGLATIITALAALVGTFIYGKKKTAEERDRKLRQVTPTAE